MKNYAKTGGKKGMPAYRTPSAFRYKKHVAIVTLKTNRTKKKPYKK